MCFGRTVSAPSRSTLGIDLRNAMARLLRLWTEGEIELVSSITEDGGPIPGQVDENGRLISLIGEPLSAGRDELGL